jgi:hypothetical protein
MDENNGIIFTNAKLEYTNQLIDILSSHLFDGIKSIYDESKTISRVSSSRTLLSILRENLEKVPGWNNELIETETSRILTMSTCDWLDDLITAVFISHTKILTSIGSTQKSNIDLTIPKTTNFIHKCYINIAREIWKNPYLYDENVSGSEYQKNMRIVETIIKESIENTIRKSLPVKDILKNHLDIYDTKNSNEQPLRTTNDIRKMLMDEIDKLDTTRAIEEKDTEKIQVSHEEMNNHPEQREESQEIIGPEETIEYESPDEEEINKKCENISINTFQKENEDIYDNVDIVQEDSPDDISQKEILEKFMNDLPDTFDESEADQSKDNVTNTNSADEENEVPSKKDTSLVVGPPQQLITDEISDASLPDFSDLKKESLNIVRKDSSLTKESKPVENITVIKKEEIHKETDSTEPVVEPTEPLTGPLEPSVTTEPITTEPVTTEPVTTESVTTEPITTEPVQEIISKEKNEEWEKETLDNFYDDVSQMMEKRGVSVNKQHKKYTLFDDISEEVG